MGNSLHDYDAMHQRLASIFNIKQRLWYNFTGDSLSYRLSLELIVTHPVLYAVKNYDLNLPEICINAIIKEIDRLDSITGAVAHTTASRDMEILELREALEAMQDKLEKAEAVIAAQKRRVWHR
jgi:hypothetical protein